MFKRKADKQDVIHQMNIKRGITSHFARTLKVLQQRHLQTDSDEFIYSDDYSNNLCSALEAVFLHGLKDSVVAKMSNYVGLASTQDQAQYINFWGMCAKFTHSDVVTELRSLAQINTDIGLCRAWIRIALNDGLMESYLHSMTIDHKLLTYYYHSHSYLRDHEQPGILKNFLTGLMSLSFKLSFNSSVLNAWSNTSLQLSGLLDSRHIPQPTVSKSNTGLSSAEVYSEYEKAQVKDEPIIINKSTKSITGSEVVSRDGISPPMFSSIRDVEEIRRITKAKIGIGAQSVASEGSTSSHISCPDPSSVVSAQNRNFKVWERESDSSSVISPALYPRADREIQVEEKDKNEKVVQDTDTHSVSSLSAVLESDTEQNRKDLKTSVVIEDSSPLFDLEIALSPPRPRSRRVTDDDMNTISPKSVTATISTHSSTSHSLSNSPKPSDFALESALVDSSVKEIKERAEDYGKKRANTKLSNTDMMRNKGASMRGYEEICATLPPLKLDPLEQEAILKKVLGEIDEQADRERERREEQRFNMSYDEAFDDSKFVQAIKEDKTIEKEDKNNQQKGERGSGILLGTASLSNPQVKGSPLPDENINVLNMSKSSEKISPDLSNSVPGSTVAQLTAEDEPAAEVEMRTKGIQDKIESEDSVKEDVVTGDPVDTGSPMSGNYGNSLSGMMGWSSEIESCPKEKDDRRLREKTRGESFTSMLKNYAGQNSLISTTLDQVIQTFYGDQHDAVNSSPPSPAGLSAEDEEAMVEFQDSCLEDFEILTPPSNSFYNIQDMDTSRSIFLFRIPREHGLSHQNFICRGCSRPIGIIYGQPRLCEFDGGLYCYECHENNEIVVPSYIVYNWDFSKRKVSVENFKFLQALEDQALYDLDDLNTKLETHVPEIGTIKVLRHQLCFLKSYMFNCTQKVAESLRQKVWPREHLYERSTVYSVNDFHQVQSGVLMRFIKDLVKFASKHVYQCSLCSQKGFVCEICRNPQVIFPFELDTTVRCNTCMSVYHKTCLTDNLPCPKCERWGKRNHQTNGADHPEDYGVSPKAH